MHEFGGKRMCKCWKNLFPHCSQRCEARRCQLLALDTKQRWISKWRPWDPQYWKILHSTLPPATLTVWNWQVYVKIKDWHAAKKFQTFSHVQFCSEEYRLRWTTKKPTLKARVSLVAARDRCQTSRQYTRSVHPTICQNCNFQRGCRCWRAWGWGSLLFPFFRINL